MKQSEQVPTKESDISLIDGSLEVEVQTDVTFVWLKSSTGAVLNSWILKAGESVTVSPLKLPFEVSAA